MNESTLAYGYVRLSRGDSRRLERLRQGIAGYCQREGLALELVFADSGVLDTAAVRPGWTALLDALGLSGVQAVVLPTLEHLSRDPVLRAEMRTRIEASGARVTVMPSPVRCRAQQQDTAG